MSPEGTGAGSGGRAGGDVEAANRRSLLELVDLVVIRLGIEAETQIAPPFGTLLAEAGELGELVADELAVDALRARLLESPSPFARLLGVLVLKAAVPRCGTGVLQALLPLLDDAHPPVAYHATWGVVRTRAIDDATLRRLERVADRPGAHLAAQAREMARRYLDHAALRRALPATLVLREHALPPLHLSLFVPSGWEEGAGARNASEAGGWSGWQHRLGEPEGMLQLAPVVERRLAVALSHAAGVTSPIDELVAELLPDLPDAEIVREELPARGGWSRRYVAHDLPTTPHHLRRVTLLKDGVVVAVTALAPRVDAAAWHGRLEEVVRSLGPTGAAAQNSDGPDGT